jgi:hypothetical protein
MTLKIHLVLRVEFEPRSSYTDMQLTDSALLVVPKLLAMLSSIARWGTRGIVDSDQARASTQTPPLCRVHSKYA